MAYVEVFHVIETADFDNPSGVQYERQHKGVAKGHLAVEAGGDNSDELRHHAYDDEGSHRLP